MKTAVCFALSALTVLIGSCRDDENKNNDDCDLAADDCADGEVCELLTDDTTRCVAPVYIRGTVLDFSDGTGIIGAEVQALDPNLTPTGLSDESEADGVYLLQVPALRDADGVPVEGDYTLRAQAAGYQLFPSGFRQSLPLTASSAEEHPEGWVIETTLTTVELIPLPDGGENLGVITGSIDSEDCDGILVVAENSDSGIPGYSDADCNYTIVNVPAGSYTVSGYAAHLQLTSTTAEVSAGETVSGIDLAGREAPLTTVTGNVQIVNAPGGSTTSVVLALESTFIDSVARGQVPPGLRAGDVSGEFVIEGVPDGNYVVLAAFENDDLVRDPDESIGGTQIVHIEVPDAGGGTTLTISEGFKVTEALSVLSPGPDEPEGVNTLTPTFEWADDSSEDTYAVSVFNAFGEEIWTEEIDGVSGSKTVTLDYAGPELEAGMYYQFRVTSIKDGTAISTTEDLEGVFFYAP